MRRRGVNSESSPQRSAKLTPAVSMCRVPDPRHRKLLAGASSRPDRPVERAKRMSNVCAITRGLRPVRLSGSDYGPGSASWEALFDINARERASGSRRDGEPAFAIGRADAGPDAGGTAGDALRTRRQQLLLV